MHFQRETTFAVVYIVHFRGKTFFLLPVGCPGERGGGRGRGLGRAHVLGSWKEVQLILSGLLNLISFLGPGPGIREPGGCCAVQALLVTLSLAWVAA